MILIILAAAGYEAYYFYFTPSNQGQLMEGILGLVYVNYVQILISVAALIIMCFIAGAILSHHKEEKKLLRFLTVLICLVPAFLVVFFLLKDPLMDIASIQNPRTVLVIQLWFWNRKKGSMMYSVPIKTVIFKRTA